MCCMPDTRNPSEVTDDYWIFAEAPHTGALARQRCDGDEITTGKWLVFVPTPEIDAWWQTIQIETEAGRLGHAAKAATACPNPNAQSDRVRLICVYTCDFEDHDDVRRVLTALRQLGVRWRLSYKTDQATHDARYGSGVSAYVSQPGTVVFDDRRAR
jgi:Domain of unknown function (DUF1917)